jgi:hippurate hydrolase
LAEAVFEEQYPVTINDPAAADEALAWLDEAFGESRVQTLPKPGMGSEDFSYVLNEVPGAFVMLATSPPGTDPATAEFNHSPRANFDDAVPGDQAAALATLAWRKLRSLAD